MKYANISLGANVEIEPSTSFNNVKIDDNVRIAKHCSIYGGPNNILDIGENSYVGMYTVLNGYAAKLTIGKNVSISQFVNIMVDSGPNASPGMLRLYPIIKGPVTIENDCWIGANSIIMPNVSIGEFSIVASNSFVNKSFPPFSVIGGTPARLIRSFSEAEKEIMLKNPEIDMEDPKSEYYSNYTELPFENLLRKYRNIKVFEKLNEYPHKKLLEIGCGPDPLFKQIDSFERIVVVEPDDLFFAEAKQEAQDIVNVVVVQGLIENISQELEHYDFDFIIIAAFPHEVSDRDAILQAVRRLCSENTIVYSYVPNARSFHRLLAEKSGIIDTIYQRSDHDIVFDRQEVFDTGSFTELFEQNGFQIIEKGSYFLKPFTHEQMQLLVDKGIFDETLLNGFYHMSDYLPDMGSELWIIAKII